MEGNGFNPATLAMPFYGLIHRLFHITWWGSPSNVTCHSVCLREAEDCLPLLLLNKTIKTSMSRFDCLVDLRIILALSCEGKGKYSGYVHCRSHLKESVAKWT